MNSHQEYLKSLNSDDIKLIDLWTKNWDLFKPQTDNWKRLIELIKLAPKIDNTIRVYRVDSKFIIENREFDSDRILSATKSLTTLGHIAASFIEHYPKPIPVDFLSKDNFLKTYLPKSPHNFGGVPVKYMKYKTWYEANEQDSTVMQWLESRYDNLRTNYYIPKLKKYTEDLKLYKDTKNIIRKYAIEIEVSKEILDISSLPDKINLGFEQQEIIIAPCKFKINDLFVKEYEFYSEDIEYPVSMETVLIEQI